MFGHFKKKIIIAQAKGRWAHPKKKKSTTKKYKKSHPKKKKVEKRKIKKIIKKKKGKTT